MSLTRKLTFVLLALLTAVLTLYAITSRQLTQRQDLQVHQYLHRDVARNLVKEKIVKTDSMQPSVAQDIMMVLMTVNPSIEVYLLDPEGRVLSHSPASLELPRETVDLEPVRAFLQPEAEYPLAGTDPRDPENDKIFSAAPIELDGEMRGYLYVVLGSAEYLSAMSYAESEKYWRLGLVALLLCVVFAFVVGVFLIRWLTRPLSQLEDAMGAFTDLAEDAPEPIHQPRSRGLRDEIDHLWESFAKLTQRITRQFKTIRATDSMRRQLIANVSHDLKTPLTSIKGYIQTVRLKGDELPLEKREAYLDTAVAGCQRLSRLVDDLSDLSYLEANESPNAPEPFQLSEVVNEVLQKFRLAAEEADVRIVEDLDPEARFVFGELGLIERVFENLISNALRFTRPGEEVRIISRPTEDGRIEVSVQDSGQGIPSEELPYLFERFYKRRQDGGNSRSSGLGLAIVRQIIKLHGSEIRVSSKPNVGTRFVFSLPRATAVT